MDQKLCEVCNEIKPVVGSMGLGGSGCGDDCVIYYLSCGQTRKETAYARTTVSKPMGWNAPRTLGPIMESRPRKAVKQRTARKVKEGFIPSV